MEKEVQVSLQTSLEALQCPEPILGRKKRNIGYKAHVLSMTPIHKPINALEKGQFNQNHALQQLS